VGLPLASNRVAPTNSDGPRQGKTGAGAFHALIENLRHAMAVVEFIMQRCERGLIGPIAQVDAIGKGVELADGLFCAGNAFRFSGLNVHGRILG
jgi:hypothetical protein